MLRLSECINEGFFGNGYDRYKRKVLDALASIGIVIDEDKMKKAEDWIRDYYADKMDAYDCASSVRDELRRYRAPVTEAFENYATEIINSAPQSKRRSAVELIRSMDNIKKAQFDHCIMSIAEKKKMDPKGVVKARGFDIMELVNDGRETPSAIVDSISRHLLDTKESMSVKEALEIIKESGKVTVMSDFIEMVVEEMQKLHYGETTSRRFVDEYYRTTVAHMFKEGFTPKEVAEWIDHINSDE